MYFAPGGSGHIVGLIIGSCQGKITLLPTKELHKWLKRLLLITRYFSCASLFYEPLVNQPGRKHIKTSI
jgi:hypothetical protein